MGQTRSLGVLTNITSDVWRRIIASSYVVALWLAGVLFHHLYILVGAGRSYFLLDMP